MAQVQKITRDRASGWVGWSYFAGALLMVAGGVNIIAGLAAIFKEGFYVVTESNLIAFNYATWGWIALLIGIGLILTGVGVWAGATWARLVAVFLAVLALLDHVAFMSAYPLWSIIGIIINGLIIYALTVHGGEAKYI